MARLARRCGGVVHQPSPWTNHLPCSVTRRQYRPRSGRPGPSQPGRSAVYRADVARRLPCRSRACGTGRRPGAGVCRWPGQVDVTVGAVVEDRQVEHRPGPATGEPARGAGTMATPRSAVTRPRTLDRSSPSKTIVGRKPAAAHRSSPSLRRAEVGRRAMNGSPAASASLMPSGRRHPGRRLRGRRRRGRRRRRLRLRLRLARSHRAGPHQAGWYRASWRRA